MRELHTLELMELVKELQTINDFYIDQFYELDSNRFRFRLSRKGEKQNLICMLPYAINRTELIEVKEEATNFSLAARKRLDGFRIKSISQYNNDRIILINLEKSDLKINIIIEMFGKGNMIITDGAMKILLAYHVHEFKERAIRPGATYNTPKNSSIDLSDKKSVDNLLNEIKSKNGDSALITYLNKGLGIGSMYVEEIITRAKIPITAKLKDLDEDRIKLLLKETRSLIEKCVEEPDFRIYKKEIFVVDFSLCIINKYSGLGVEEFDSFEKSLDFFYQNVEIKEREKSEQEKKMLSSIEKQKAILNEIDNEIEKNRKIGDYTMNHMHDINRIIEHIKSNKNSKIEELNAISEKVEVLDLNMKNKSIKIKEKESVDQ